MNGLHHVSIGIKNLPQARAFYDAVLGVVGLQSLKITAESVDYGDGNVCFSLETPVDGAPATAGNGVHVAFRAPDRQAVRRFHEVALASGGTDAGPPGLRPQYSPDYFGAFVFDPEGNKIEAVTDEPQ